MIKAEIIGADKLIKKFEELGDLSGEVFEELLVETAAHTRAKAVEYIGQNVKTGTGHLKQSMFVNQGDDWAEVGNGAEYAGYVEFGTGRKVNVPQEMQSVANKIKSRPTKSFSQGLQAIRDWCKRLGIDVKAAYPIFMSILRDGLRPRPFLYPAYRSGVIFMEKEAKNKMEMLKKKFTK